MNYLIVLFKNKEKKKIINKFKTFKKAELFFDEKIKESSLVVFPKEVISGDNFIFELALMERKNNNHSPIYIKDDLGRTIKVELDDKDFVIKKIFNFKIEEQFVDYNTKNKIDFSIFDKKYLRKSGLKLLSKLNNKVVLQIDDFTNLFTFKSENDCERFLDILILKFTKENRRDCLIVKDTSSPQKKYLYNLLVDLGYPKSYLQRYSTAHLVKR
jgi:hypothetical protein